MYHTALVSLSREFSGSMWSHSNTTPIWSISFKVNGQCHTTVQVNKHVFEATFIVVDVSTQYWLFGLSRIKSLVRSYLWQPQLNTKIEEMAQNCQQCCAVSPNPPTAPTHPWLVPHDPWEILHIVYAQWKKWLLLVAVDAFSKWPEVFVVNSTSASQTIDKLRTIFGFLQYMVYQWPLRVSDNDPPFSSSEF